VNRTNKENKDIILSGLSFVFGTFCLALCYNLFFVPNNIVVGGTSGIAIIIENITGFDRQLFIYLASFILLVISFVFLGKEYTKKVVIGSILYPLFVTFTYPISIVLLRVLIFDEILVTVVLATLLYGFSNGIIYKYGHSTGGIDVIVKIMVKYLHFSEGKSLIIINTIIILSASFVFGVNIATYAILISIVSSLIVDRISIGISISKKFLIYNEDYEKLKLLISEEFKAGYTIFPTVEGYSHNKGKMIMCVIRNRDVNLFKERILEIDNNAFFVISDCYEVQGGVRRSNLPFME
jgi:uncharacterized membrane-anchored protein YitT (DUF2179 family)